MVAVADPEGVEVREPPRFRDAVSCIDFVSVNRTLLESVKDKVGCDNVAVCE
jgi:hypothetical protein